MLARCAPLDHAAYFEPAVFAREQVRLFRRCWLFAGLAGDFSATPRRIATAGQVVDIAAPAAPGAGWSARSDDGPGAVALCGNLVFYSLAAEPPPLESHLAPYFNTLRALSTGLPGADHRLRRVVAANWKTLAENALDDYHAAAVHPGTLHRSMLDAGERHMALGRAGPHSLLRNTLNPADAAFWDRICRRLAVRRFDDAAEYRHLFIFPNLYIASFHGAALILHRIDPLDPELAALELDFCLPLDPAGAAGREALKRAVLADFAAKADAILAEDIAVCELAQRGRRFAFQPVLLGLSELRIGDFQDAVLAALGDGAADDRTAAPPPPAPSPHPWESGWFPAGPAGAVAADGDHLAIDLPALSLTVQNFRGTLAGFVNVCSHRAAQLRPCSRGNGLLRCPYHGWAYNRAGVPVGIPENAALFQLGREERQGLALRPVAVAQRGGFLFLRLAAAGPGLDEALGEAGALLDAAGAAPAAGQEVAVERPSSSIAEAWAAQPAVGRRVAVHPGFILDMLEGWTLVRYVLPMGERRSLAGAALFHPGSAPLAALPAALGMLWQELSPSLN